MFFAGNSPQDARKRLQGAGRHGSRYLVRRRLVPGHRPPFHVAGHLRQLLQTAPLCDYVHKHSTMQTVLPSCGSVYSLMPHCIGAGFDVINPVQTACYQMESERLKKDFGCDVIAPGGGFILTPSTTSSRTCRRRISSLCTSSAGAAHCVDFPAKTNNHE